MSEQSDNAKANLFFRLKNEQSKNADLRAELAAEKEKVEKLMRVNRSVINEILNNFEPLIKSKKTVSVWYLEVTVGLLKQLSRYTENGSALEAAKGEK